MWWWSTRAWEASRRPILLEAAGQYFVAPDNGVLSMVYGGEKHKVRLISNEKYSCIR